MSSIYFQTMGFAIVILLLIMFFSKERVNNKETKIYSKILVCTFFALIFDITIILVTYFFALERVYVLLWILNKFYLSSLLLYVSLFTEYIVCVSTSGNEKTFFNGSKKGYILLNSLFIFIIFILPLGIYNENGAMFSYGMSINFLLCILVIFLIVMIFYIGKGFKHVDREKYIPLFSLLPLFLLALLIRNYDPSVLITTAIAAYVDLIMYFTIENPDVKMIRVLNESKIAAEKANRAKSDFLSSMSHEIRTPLNAIVGFSDCILEEESLSEAKSDAKDIKLASENLLEIVNGILDISKIEADKMEIVETDYSVLDVLDNVAKLVKPRIGDKPIEFNVKFAPDIPYMVYGDGGKLRQIVTNILTNAVKYTENGSVSFQVNCVNDNEYTKLIISVEDTGRGIKPEQIDKLFTKFQRLDEDKNTTLEGTGLGLAITKRFVEMLGGKIVVQSKYGEGSKFTVYLRQKIVKMNKPQNISEEDLVNTTKMKLFDFSSSRVLVVDDNKINLKVALKLLSNYGIKADASESGSDCLDRLSGGEVYDLILLDDMMPKMSGVETLKKIRETVIYDMPVIALTANALSGMKEKYLADGFDDYLSKPIEKNELYRILIDYLHSKISVVDLPKERKEEKIELPEERIIEKKDDLVTNDDKKSILIVDDNKLNIKIATKLLSDKNVKIDSALSGSEAIEKCQNNGYDLILMDIMMPEMDGVEALHHLKEEFDFKNPIIAVTADAVAGAEEKYLKEGFDDYVAKPINNDIINDILSKFLH